MKKYHIYADAYGCRQSKCFHKVIESNSQKSAEDYANRWCDSLMDETGDEFDEWEVVGVEEYHETDHEVGDCWENVIDND